MSWLSKLLPNAKTPNLADSMDEYIHYRKVGRALHTKIITSKQMPVDINAIAKRMGILEGKTIIFESESEMDAVADFGLGEMMVNGKNHFQRYAESQFPDTTPDEYVVLKARSNSTASLFEIMRTDRQTFTVFVKDLLNGNQLSSFQEIGLSQTAVPGYLIYTRLLDYPNFRMTSGVSFLFNPEHKDRLMKGYGLMKFKANGKLRSDQRYLYFFRQNRAWGEQIDQLDVG